MMGLRVFINLITFPGVIFHEFSHYFFCKLTGIKVKKVCFFRFGNPSGYVVHEIPKAYSKEILISLSPLIFNSLIAILFFILGHSRLPFLWYWLGFSAGFNAFPSNKDASALWRFHFKRKKFNPITLGLSLILGVVVWLINILRYIWFDAIYVSFLFWISKFIMF